MPNLKEKIVSGVMKIGMKFAGVSQDLALEALGEPTVTEGMPEILRKAAAEGAVLLKNDGVLPFSQNSTVSVFGRIQKDWFFTGYGSGGDVKKPYGVNLIDGIRNCEKLNLNEELADFYEKWCEKNKVDDSVWGMWPRYYPEPELSEEMIKNAREKSDCAVFIIGRSSGEDRENVLEKGSFYLTDEEKKQLSLVTSYFEKTAVLLNIGSIIDMSWINSNTGAVMIVWQGGMESGNAAADLLCGKISPCGYLTDTIAERYEDYPSSQNFGNKEFNEYKEDIFVGYRYFETFKKKNVLYPFGFGLSYTEFERKLLNVQKNDGEIEFVCEVKNTGESFSGKTAVQVYVSKPCGNLGNPARELVGFKKTDVIAPGESVEVKITVPEYYLCSYDDSGKSGYAYSYVMENGEYSFFLGGDVRNAEKVWSFNSDSTVCVQKLEQTSAAQSAFNRMIAVSENGSIKNSEEPVKCREYNLRDIIKENMPDPVPMQKCVNTFSDVKNGKITMREFVAQLDLDELEAISRGDYKMDSPLGAKGNAGAIGGVTESLRQKGVPAVITTDGPSGIRLLAYCSLIPIGTLLACSFDTELVTNVYSAISREMTDKGSDILLAPGMNIHRSPLCGRNFEYYSEDPVLTGLIASAAVSGIQSEGVSACPKHFACNNQEFNRTHNDSRLSERALREIYLKGFEICVKTSAPKCIMTSYNKINGVWGHYNYELCERVLRGEWNFKGTVMTDWWMRSSKSPEFPNICDNAYRVRSSVDVLMPGGKRTGKSKPDGTLLKTFGKTDGITLAEMQRTAERVLNLCMDLKM